MEELDAYMRTLLWQATDEEGEPLDSEYAVEDFAPESWSLSEGEMVDFVTLCEEDGIDPEILPVGQVGHDFALTRNRHGAGFWDRGNGELGDRLTHWAHTMGSAYVYVGDDGRVYVD